MALQGLADTVLKDLKHIMESKSIVGDAIEIGNKTLIPVTKISFGFGIGGTLDEKNKDSGGGTGGGASVEPVCFLIVDENGADIIRVNTKKELWEKLIDLPQTEEIINKIGTFFSKEKKKKEDNK